MNAPEQQYLDQRREVPTAIEAEQSILGALMGDNDAIDRIGSLRAEHFYRYDHRLIFGAIQKLIVTNRRADMITVFESLQASGHADQVGGLPYLNSLVGAAPGSAGIVRWAEIVIDRWKLRGILSATDEIAELVHNRGSKTVSEIINEAQAKFEPLVVTTNQDPQFIGAFLTPIIERIDAQFHGGEAKVKALSTGLRDLDAKLGGGMRPGQLIIVAGRPAMGKTAMSLGLAESAANDGAPSMFFSLEMPGEELCNRALSRASGLSLDKIIDGKKMSKKADDADWSNLTRGVQVVVDQQIVVDEQPGLSLAEIRARARNVKRRHGLGLIVIDYLGLMADGEGNTRNEKVGANSRGLKALAKQMDVPVVLLCQLNRKLEERGNKRPMLSDLRDSGEIEQDADIVLFLYRDEVYNPNTRDRGIGEINIAKQRNGPTGTVAAAYIGERTLFADLMPGVKFGQQDEEPQKPARRGFE
ncbi:MULTISPECIES: replicative DNA helicase [unclassified Burkholderia]|uniref:replicative DNA helicase n=1 Tax=unclassified Burkholderia TaxID=2613784 RepID=UPI000F57EC94|nr:MULTISPECIES: replicative DNA helicase [unclassified Burkholderia]RQR87694.1 replicative DNA helicase [Burkholderia sp. Bp9011]RQR97040.1 replicative DNA helicase [Burkholderia sp. Bp9010]